MMKFPFRLDGLRIKARSKTLSLQKFRRAPYLPNSHILPRILRGWMPGPRRSFCPPPPGLSPQGLCGDPPRRHQTLAHKPPGCRPTLPTPPLPPAVPSSPRPARQSEVRAPEQAYDWAAKLPRGGVRNEPAACSAGPLPARRVPAEPDAPSWGQRGGVPHRWAVAGGSGGPPATVRRARSWLGSKVSERLPEWLFAAFHRAGIPQKEGVPRDGGGLGWALAPRVVALVDSSSVSKQRFSL